MGAVRALRLSVLALSLLLGLVAAPAWARAAPVDLAAQRQARMQDRDADRARAADAQHDVERLRAQLIALGREEASGERTVGGARGALARLNLEEAELKLRMGHNEDSLTRLLGALQMFQRHPPPPLLVDPRSALDAVRAAILIKAIAPELEARSRAFAAQAEALKRVRRRVAETNGALFQAESDVADRQARIETLIDQKRTLERQLYTDADVAEQAARRLATRGGSMGAFVQSLDANVADGRLGSEGASPPQAFTPPVQGTLVRRFGERGDASPGDAADRLHASGWTWTADPGAAVLSPAAGLVEYAGPLKDWGLVVILRVGETHVVLVGLASLDVDTGRPVAAGEPVGRMAAGPDRPQLYLEVRRGVTPVDPAPWFPTIVKAGSA